MEHTKQRGRPRLTLDLDTELLSGLGRVGLDLEGAAEVLDCSRRTLCDRFVQCPELRRAYRQGAMEFRAITIAGQMARISLLRAARAASATAD